MSRDGIGRWVRLAHSAVASPGTGVLTAAPSVHRMSYTAWSRLCPVEGIRDRAASQALSTIQTAQHRLRPLRDVRDGGVPYNHLFNSIAGITLRR